MDTPLIPSSGPIPQPLVAPTRPLANQTQVDSPREAAFQSHVPLAIQEELLAAGNEPMVDTQAVEEAQEWLKGLSTQDLDTLIAQWAERSF
jgi:hypothetical protein